MLICIYQGSFDYFQMTFSTFYSIPILLFRYELLNKMSR